jgi:hypothetical protein
MTRQLRRGEDRDDRDLGGHEDLKEMRGGPLISVPDEAADLNGMGDSRAHDRQGHQEGQDRAEPPHRRRDYAAPKIRNAADAVP